MNIYIVHIQVHTVQTVIFFSTVYVYICSSTVLFKCYFYSISEGSSFLSPRFQSSYEDLKLRKFAPLKHRQMSGLYACTKMLNLNTVGGE